MFTKQNFLGTNERTACTRQRIYSLHVTFTFAAVYVLVTFEIHYISINPGKSQPISRRNSLGHRSINEFNFFNFSKILRFYYPCNEFVYRITIT